MAELFRVFQDFDNSMIFTMFLIGLAALGWISWVYGTASQSGLEISSSQWFQIYIAGTIIFFSGAWLLGLLLFPENAKNLMEMLYMKDPIEFLTKHVRAFTLEIIKKLS
ncbi:MAG: hypothetical protein HQM10_19555 [Candidatus Riflebacteria bacterium]|nr:hypothetical protein [Candidatus Riflebacteria bacterium]